MLNNTVMLDTWLQSLQVLCDLEGAKADNMLRERHGEAPAYGPIYFSQLSDLLQTLRGNLR
jgi:hypothetical protein